MEYRKRFISLLAVLLTAMAATASAATPYWIQLGQADSLVDAKGLAQKQDRKCYVCVDRGKFLVVDRRAYDSRESALKDAKGDMVVQIPSGKCFSPQVVTPGRKYPQPPSSVSLQAAKKFTGKTDKYKWYVKNRATTLQGASVEVLPEVTTRVAISNRDTNRIVCQGEPAKDVILSEEKGVFTEIVGSSVFVKLGIMKAGKKDVYLTTPIDIHVVCGQDTIYSLVAVPDNLPIQTIYLKKNNDKAKKNLALFSGLSFEKRVIRLMKEAYKGVYPESYTVSTPNRHLDELDETGIRFRLVTEVIIEGEGLYLKEYYLMLQPDFPKQAIKVEEKYFLDTNLTTNPVAIALSRQTVDKDRPTRLFIIEKRNSG